MISNTSDNDVVGVSHRVLEIDHVQKLSNCLQNSLFLNSEYADVHLVVYESSHCGGPLDAKRRKIEGQRFPGHKNILATRSEYFRILLFGGYKESKEDEVEIQLDGASIAAFKALLEYVYTGRLGGLEENVILDLWGHKWGFKELENGICEHLQATLELRNVCTVLNKSLAFGTNSKLIMACCTFGDNNAVALLEHPSFCKLSPAGITELLSRDTFLTSEEKIFEQVAGWIQHNVNVYSEKEYTAVKKNIRLPLLKMETLFDSVKLAEIASLDEIFDAVQMQRKNSSQLQYRACLKPYENVCHITHGATVVKGDNGDTILDVHSYDWSKGYVAHIICKNESDGIVLKLGRPYILNNIRIQLLDLDFRRYSYYVEVSMDQKHWVRICDHTKQHCRSWQNMFFTERAIMFIKIVGTDASDCEGFHVVQVQAFYTTKKVLICPKFGVLCPTHNVATVEHGACVVEGNVFDQNTAANVMIDIWENRWIVWLEVGIHI